MSSRFTYTAFVLRCWRSDDGGWRIDVEHAQTRRSGHFASLAEAERWMAEQLAAPPSACGDAAGVADLSLPDEKLPIMPEDQAAATGRPDETPPPRTA